MMILPAIDIRNGKCVRLFQGDYSQETIYSDDPFEMALKWKNLGAQIIHVVDLDGAKDGSPTNIEVISKIAEEIQIEVGGGIRSIETIQKYLNAGVYRVVLGTIILEDFNLAGEIFERFNNKVVVGLDAKNGVLMKKGWVAESGLGVFETAKKLQELGAKRIIYTDILKDGSLTEPNYKAIKRLIDKLSIPVIASGGVAFTDQILQLKRIGAEGVIIGKALYEGGIDLKEAISKC
jgi:phosphoribosylformimino-5-aminoimidazole carboxamide ribotide isomerase